MGTVGRLEIDGLTIDRVSVEYDLSPIDADH